MHSANKLSELSEESLLTTTDKAEFAGLANSLNLLIGRVRHSALLQEQFASDAAHELRNPLALMRTRIESTLLRDRTSEDYKVALRQVLLKVEHLSSVVETLLFSARYNGQETPPISFDAEVLHQIAVWVESTAWPSERLQVNCEACQVSIGAEEVGIIVRNLLDNAARHAPGETPVVVTLSNEGAKVNLTVRDFGAGLTESDRVAAFERFYRSDESRSGQEGGSGIGLAVVKRVVQSRHGVVEFEDVQPGAMVRITFPASNSTSAS